MLIWIQEVFVQIDMIRVKRYDDKSIMISWENLSVTWVNPLCSVLCLDLVLMCVCLWYGNELDWRKET